MISTNGRTGASAGAGTVEPDEFLALDPVRRAAQLVWPNLPVLLIGSVVAVIPQTLRRLIVASDPVVAGLVAIVGALLAVVMLAPLLHAATVLVDGEHAGIVSLVRRLPVDVARAVPIVIMPAGTALLGLAAAAMWSVHHQTWLLVSLGAGLTATTIGTVVLTTALPYRLRHHAGVRESFVVGAYAVIKAPVPVVGVLSAAVLLALVAAGLGILVCHPPFIKFIPEYTTHRIPRAPPRSTQQRSSPPSRRSPSRVRPRR